MILYVCKKNYAWFKYSTDNKKLPYLKRKIKLFSVSADSVKTGGMTVMGDYTWAVAQMKVYYVASTKKVTGANTQVTYKFPAQQM